MATLSTRSLPSLTVPSKPNQLEANGIHSVCHSIVCARKERNANRNDTHKALATLRCSATKMYYRFNFRHQFQLRHRALQTLSEYTPIDTIYIHFSHRLLYPLDSWNIEK